MISGLQIVGGGNLVFWEKLDRARLTRLATLILGCFASLGGASSLFALDTTPPDVEFEGSATTEPILTGFPEKNLWVQFFDDSGVASFTLNGEPVPLYRPGRFDWVERYGVVVLPLVLDPGPNHYTIEVTDGAVPANISRRSFVVIYDVVDTDEDGMPDGWETVHGLDPTSSEGVNGARGDLDGDQICNLVEFETFLPPNSPSKNPLAVSIVTDKITKKDQIKVAYNSRINTEHLTVRILISHDLTTWRVPEISGFSGVIVSGSEIVSSTLTLLPYLDEAPGGQMYVRLEVTSTQATGSPAG